MKTTDLLKILSSETKAKIIYKLFTCKCDWSVNDLCAEFEVKQSNLSKHLMDLRKDWIVEFKKDGKESFYKLNDTFRKNKGKLIKAIIETSDCNEMGKMTKTCPKENNE